LHWRWIVSKNVVDKYECICFHMTDVPYGRGGSPLQNLIVRGQKKTVLTALRMSEKVDAGPFFFKRPLSLKGTAEQIYRRAARLSWEMVKEFVGGDPVALPQEGEVVNFERRTPEQSCIPKGLATEQVYDYIRMLDAPGYPHAFIVRNGYRLEFTNAEIASEKIIASVKITLMD